MLTFEPPDLQEKIKAAFLKLEDYCEHDWYDLTSNDFDPSEYDGVVTQDSVIEGFGFCDSDDGAAEITVTDLLRMASLSGKKLLKSRSHFFGENKFVIHVEPRGEKAFTLCLARWNEQATQPPIQTTVESENRHFSASLRCGSPEFAVLLSEDGGCDRHTVSAYDNNRVFVEVVCPNGTTVETARSVADAFLFEIAASHDLYFEPSSIPSSYDMISDDNEVNMSEVLRLRPLKIGDGMNELHRYYLQGVAAEAEWIRLICLVKVLEYVSVTVIRESAHETLRQRLLDASALAPTATFIDDLLLLIENQRVFKKDAEAIKATLLRCCDALLIKPYAPECLTKLRSITEDTDEKIKKTALVELSECLTASRNQFAHAKVNYETTGFECPTAQLGGLVMCARKAAEQVIRRYAELPETRRVIGQGNP